MSTTTATIARAINHLRWLTTAPHTIEWCVQLQAQQRGAEHTRWPYGTSPAKMAADITASAIGTGQHRDPTGDSLNRTSPPAHPHGAIHHATDKLCSAAIDAQHHAARLLEAEPRTPRPSSTLNATIAEAALNLIHIRDRILPLDHDTRPAAIAALDDDQHLGWLLHDIADQAEWIRTTCEQIHNATTGPIRTAVPGRRPDECRICSPWRSGTIAVSRGRCQQCATFQDHHKCKPTEAIVRRWEATGTSATPPGMIIEAKAGRRKAKAS